MKYARYQKCTFNHYQRIFITSDIHGDDHGFLMLLDRINIQSNDALIIVGDILEKGAHSLLLLRRIMQLSKTMNIYICAGNNDTIFEDWKNHHVKDENIHWYIHSRPHSIIKEMALELNKELNCVKDISFIKDELFQHFHEEITFLNQLPHIIECEFAIFAHAGIDPYQPITKQDIDFVLTAPSFGNQKHVFPKKVIVGHWPASNYCKDIICVAPYFHDSNVISIDGGNSMKSWGQINCLIYQPQLHTFSLVAYDNLPKVKLLDHQFLSKDHYSLQFPHTEINILTKNDVDSICFIPHLNKTMTFLNHQIYHYKGKDYISDQTTYKLELQKDDIVSFVKKVPNGILIKRNHIISFYEGNYQFL